MAFRIAIIGMGKIAHDQHVPVIAKNPNFELAAVVSQRGVHPPGVPVFVSTRELYEKTRSLDAVAICTPPAVRHALAREALAAGKHVLLEKPPTPTLSELFDLESAARTAKRVLFTTWHSQYNAAVVEAKTRLAGSGIRSLDIEWKEDVRRWHPGQEWIWQPGGFGVFDPGINALSIITAIMPSAILVKSAELFVPRNRQTPIAASLALELADDAAARLQAEFDWRQTGVQSWNITIETADGRLLHLRNGGARLEIGSKPIMDAPPQEYEEIYARFAKLLAAVESDVDPAPLRLVADAFMLGRRVEVEPFD
jgi:D-galactose 1-dehydrogenase